jgi:hypothetical protein
VRPLARFDPQFRRIWRNRKRKPATIHSLRPIHWENSIAINCAVQITDKFNELLTALALLCNDDLVPAISG